MKIRKESPSWHIIADTKINAQSFQKYTDTFNQEFELNWIKANGKTQSVSLAEKMLEAMAADFLGLKNTKGLPCGEFLTQNFANLEGLFEHFSLSIVFHEVSNNFIQNIVLQKLSNIKIHHKKYSDMSMWLPPAFEHPVVGNTYGTVVGEITQSIEKFIKEAQEAGVKEEDAVKTALTMMPMAQHGKAIISASMTTWRDLVLKLSEHNVDTETRYIMLHLCRDLKMRYLGFFSDMALQSQDGKVYGLDTITNDGFWQKSQIVKKR
jgi:hypothetical protein